MGTALVTVYAVNSKNERYPGLKRDKVPRQVATEATSTTVTVAGSRIVIAPVPNNQRDYICEVVHDEACYVACGADPTAAVPPALSWRTVPNVALTFVCQAGDKLSFKEVA